MADYPGAIWMPVPDRFVFPDAWGYTRHWLILHRTAGGSTAQGVAQWFISGSGGARVSAHYIVGLDGTVVQCVRERDGAGGNGIVEVGHASWWDPSINPNLLTFSIEAVDPTSDNSTVMPEEQKTALFALVKSICERNGIPMRPADARGGITGHFSIAPQSRADCPGQNFPWDDLWAYLGSAANSDAGGKEETMLSIKQVEGYFVEVVPDERWHCTVASRLDGHEHDIAYGMLAFYRTVGASGLNGLTLLGLPLGDEEQVPGHPHVTFQRMERAILVYDPNHEVDRPPQSGPVYLAHLDAPFLTAEDGTAPSTGADSTKEMDQHAPG